MIFRPSQTLASKIKAGSLAAHSSHSNPFADWTARLFLADRIQYVLVTNTQSLYSTLFAAKGMTNQHLFIQRATICLVGAMSADLPALDFDRLVGDGATSAQFAKALNRSVTGSMNDLVFHATLMLTEHRLSPLKV